MQAGSLGLYKGGEELRRAVAALAGPNAEHREVCNASHAMLPSTPFWERL